MPAAVAKGAIVVATLVAAAAIAVYESPEVRQFAEDCRRRIAVALHSLGDEINPPSRTAPQQPRYNRPEDAEGFMQSSAQGGVDADEDSKRRQREELMYWNQVRLERLEREKKLRDIDDDRKDRPSSSSDIDAFLHSGATVDEKDPHAYNTGADVHGGSDEGLMRRRGEGIRGLDRGAAFANPFADQYEMEEQQVTDMKLISPEPSEMSDIYGMEDIKPTRARIETIAHEEPLVDVSESQAEELAVPEAVPAYGEVFYTSGTEAHPDSAFASIHAWADNSNNASFYSPLPVSPAAPASEASEPEDLSGQLTPTDSVSLAGSGEDVARDDDSIVGEGATFYDLSEDGESINTPSSWTEVGSEASEDEHRD